MELLNRDSIKIGNFFSSLLILVLLCFSVDSVKAQLSLNEDTVNRLITTSPAFTIFKDNFFITGTSLIETPTKYNSDIKFQVSFKYRLTNKPIWFGFYPFLSYTQKTFWNIYLKSAPFGESNYNPTLFAVKPLFKDNKLNSALMFSFEHESNGKDTANGSRGWNYIAATYTRYLRPNIFATAKVWFPFGYNGNPAKYWGNPDLIKYIGYGELSANWSMPNNRFSANILARKGASWSWKGSLELDLSYRPSLTRNIYIMAQWFGGYAESLINYTEKQSNFRVGIVMKPTFHKFY